MTNAEKFEKLFGLSLESAGLCICDKTPNCQKCRYFKLPLDECKKAVHDFWNSEAVEESEE